MPDAPALDTSRPNVARVYDYWLGGKENFAADREQAEKLAAFFPGIRQLVRENREFITRAVSWVAGQGISQFIDVGAGLPTSPSTHEAARSIHPTARVAYVDNDPLVVVHASTLLAGGKDGITAVTGDLREPAALLADPGLREVVDPDQPVCLILAAVLHLMDADAAAKIADGYIRLLAPGSYVIITMARYEDPVLGDRVMREYTAGTFFNHSLEQAATFFTGLELIKPGLTNGRTWRAGLPAQFVGHDEVYPLAGVARKP
jgi:S-adenosyl methyltransferase